MQDTNGIARQQGESFLTISETARLLRLSDRSTYRLARDGKLAGAVRFGARWRVDREALMTWVREHQQQPSSDSKGGT